MKKLELQLAENVEFALETKNKDLIEDSFFIYKTYVFSMKQYKLEYNWRLFESLKNKYISLIMWEHKSL